MFRLFNYTALISALAVAVTAQTLNVHNNCGEQVFLFTQTSFGSIANNVFVNPGATQNMGISSNWDGAINVGKWLYSSRISKAHTYITFKSTGTGCSSSGACTTGGPTWDGSTPFSRAELNFVRLPSYFLFSLFQWFSVRRSRIRNIWYQLDLWLQCRHGNHRLRGVRLHTPRRLRKILVYYWNQSACFD